MTFFTPIYLLAALACPKVELVNKSKEDVNYRDMENVSVASKRCKHHFPKSPCLVKFTKTAPLTYKALCGAKR
jgi:hypothetical protein